MQKITMLGTGMGSVMDLYNTCFVIQNDKGSFLVDTGGSIEILKRLKMININLEDIHHIFISHNHTDHILGFIWMLKKIGVYALNGKIKDRINVYCNDVVYESIKAIYSHTLPQKFINEFLKVIDFHVLSDNEQIEINGINYTFFDINAKSTKQYGFECFLNGKRLVFLGDETMNPILNERVRGADYVMHEAFCLDSEENIFHAYQKNHSTVKSASEALNQLDVKNIILYHTEESHENQRKKLYIQEAKENFDGNVIVPNDLEIIEIN